VFVSEVPRGREAKIAYGLRSKGWTVTLLHKTTPNYDLHRYFDVCIPYLEPEDVVRHAAQFRPVVYHLFALAGDLSCTHMINAKVGPTVFDTTDLLETTYLGNEPKTEQVRPLIDMQMHGLRYADGYCARDLQFQYAHRTLGYHLGGRPIFCPEYCGGIAKKLVDSRAENGGRTIRCVLAGNFGIEKLGEGDWGYMRIAEKFIAAKVALDLYPSWLDYARGEEEFSNIFADYLALAQTSDYFNLRRPLRADQLTERLSDYDFGVNITWSEVAGQRSTTFNPAFHPYCMSARVFDYLDAGLPVVLSKSHRLVHTMLRRYGAGIQADADFMANIEQKLRPLANVETKNRAVAASRGLAIERHIDRLAAFYYRVATDAGVSVSPQA